MADILKLVLILAVVSISLMSSNGSDIKSTKKGNPISQTTETTTKKVITTITNKPAQFSNSRKPPSANKDPRKRASTKAPTVDELFEAFKKKYNKTYSSAQEEAEAKKIFEKNLNNDQQHNQKKSGYQRGTNSYSDKNHDWKVKYRMGAKKSRSSSGVSALSTKSSLAARMGEDSSIPDSANWTDWNSPVKDQADCGTCWIYAPLAVLEYLTIVIRENLTDLSVQEILDCNDLGDGCDGGWPTDSFNYIISKGITRQKSYPYVSYQSDCLAKRFDRVLSINETYEELLNGDEDQLKYIVYNYGPTVVVIYASDGFTQYAGGVFFETDCPNDPESYNHAIVVVGYGTDPEAGDFWIIKNSWGKDWGEYGYGRIARNKGNMCGIANYAMNPSSSWISFVNFNQTKNGNN